MARIAGIDLPRRKAIVYALPYIYGIGDATARKLCKMAKVPEDRKVDELSEADVKNIRDAIDASIKVEGDYAFGTLRTETGVHRLVRKSPFDSSGGRHTSFASVFVYPEVDDSIQVDINPADLRVDTYRASGAGGQHINKTDSAVRITHMPSGIVVQCQNERSQTANKQTALRILKSRLAERQEEERDAVLAKERGVVSMGFGGNAIRSYVLHPYQLVKDHRTDYEMGNTQGVLDGDLEGFIQAYLLAKAAGKAV